MASRDLLALPLEILDEICSLLHDTHKPSLSSFSLVNKRCCTFSTAWIFRHVILEVRGSQSLSKDLADLEEVLQRRNAFDSIHRITISGFLRLYRGNEVEPPPPVWTLDNANQDGHDEIYGTEWGDTMFNPRPSATAEELAAVWQPLVSMIRKTNNLKYLDYNCSNPLPMNIVHALEQVPPPCHLHVEHFQYRHLTNGMKAPSEIGLAKSPVLHSIQVRYVDRDSAGIDNYNREAIIRTVGGVIPNLKRLRLVQCFPPVSRELHIREGERRPPWSGFQTDIGPSHPASLDYFACKENLNPQNLREFTTALSFDNLKHLELQQRTSNYALRYFTHRVKFRQLHTLSLFYSKPYPDDPVLEPQIPAADLATFLSSLAPLRSLNIKGFLTEDTVSTIISHHGGRLRDLKLQPDADTYWRSGIFQKNCVSLDEFERLPEACPHLEYLQIPVQRSKSKGEEVKCYKALSSCKNLRHLFIELKCDKANAMPRNHILVPHARTVAATDTDSDAEPNDEAVYDGSRRPLYGVSGPPAPNIAHIKRAFQNCALDETLARSIWGLIAGKKQGCPLHSLKLYPVGAVSLGGGGGYQHELIQRTRVLSRAFLLQKPPRDDASAVRDVQVKELGKRAREAHIRQDREYERNRGFARSGLDDLMEKAFRRIWPERKESSIDWRDDWHSLPLELDDAEE